MKPGVEWLVNLFGRKKAVPVARAYAMALNPDSIDGGLILADLAHYCRAGQTSFVPGDPHQTAFNEGARDAFLHVAEMVGLTPNDFPRILKEAAHERD